MRGDVLEVAVRDGGRTFSTELPTRWTRQGTTRANRLLKRAQTAMRASRRARVRAGLERAGLLRTDGVPAQGARPHGVHDQRRHVERPHRRPSVAAHGRRPDVADGAGGTGPLRFRTRRWFRWTPYAQHVRLLGERRTGAGRRLAELALFDPGTPVWMTLTVDVSSHRVLRERSITKAHFATQRYHSFNEPVRILAPEAAGVD